MEQTAGDGNGEALRFEVRGGALWVLRKGEEFCLGEDSSALEAMAGYLGERDFGE